MKSCDVSRRLSGGSLVQVLQMKLLLFPVGRRTVSSDATSSAVPKAGPARRPALNLSSPLLTVMSRVFMHISLLSKSLISDVSAEAVSSAPADLMIASTAIP